MMLTMFRQARNEPADIPEPAETGPSAQVLHSAVSSIAERAGSTGRGAAAVRGVIEDTTQAAQCSALAVSALAVQGQEITRAQEAIGTATRDSHGAVEAGRGFGVVADRLFPAVQERMPTLSPKLVYCIAVDRTGLASARSTRPFRLQTCRREMGGGRFVVMKDAAAPIVVGGRHWGGLRLAFQF